ncbi:MAG: hypothetical protein O2782_18130 [bacterium]|nr:hypothetical protein [bacterium]
MNDMRRILSTLLCLMPSSLAWAEATDRPLVAGGITDKPFINRSTRMSLGGYTETHLRWEREAGVTEELTFDMKRFNLFVYSPVSSRLRVAAEIEFEEKGEEIVVEAALIDFELHPAVTMRAGILLAPLGRFNIAHDSPANDLTDRPLMNTELIGTALSEVGMGFHGALFPSAASRVTYEVYAVNGFHDGVAIADAAGTRIPAGKDNIEDNNSRPSLTGRLAVSPGSVGELGLSAHSGPYNTWEIDGLDIDKQRNLTMVVVDGDFNWRSLEVLGEYATASIDVPAASSLLADGQSGFYLQANATFGHGWLVALPEAEFTAVTRWGQVDFDTDVDGDSQNRLTLGLNLRPVPDAVFKLDYQRNWIRDRFNNEAGSAALLFSVATYF